MPFCAKVGSQETPGVTGKFGLGITNEAGHRLIEFYQVNALVIANTLFQQHKRSAVKYLANMGCSDIHDPKKKITDGLFIADNCCPVEE